METDHQTTVVEIDDFVTFRRAGKIWSGVKKQSEMASWVERINISVHALQSYEKVGLIGDTMVASHWHCTAHEIRFAYTRNS